MVYALQNIFATVSGKVRAVEQIFLGKTDEINEERTGTAGEFNRWLRASTIDNPFYSRHSRRKQYEIETV